MARLPKAIYALIGVLLAARPAPAAEREVQFEGAGGVRLSGTLLLPEAATRHVPAVVLVAGSGPTDRNGNQPPLLWTGLLKQTAEMLADAGIASLRYDKRGLDRSGARPKDPGELARFAACHSAANRSPAGNDNDCSRLLKLSARE